MKLVPLSQGKFAKVDDEDFERVNQFKWCYGDGRVSRNAGKGANGKYTYERIHRVIMKAPKGVLVDHIDGDALNNQKSNLRFADKSENARNQRRLLPQNKSGYRGVSWAKNNNKWVVYVNYRKKRYNAGYFEDKKDAARKWNEEMAKLDTEFTVFNNV